MALPNWVAGALRPALSITWTREDDTAEDLTGATVTGILHPATGKPRAIAGVLTVTTATSGIFRWDFVAADVKAGTYKVQFNAAFGSGQTPAKTFVTEWVVKESLEV